METLLLNFQINLNKFTSLDYNKPLHLLPGSLGAQEHGGAGAGAARHRTGTHCSPLHCLHHHGAPHCLHPTEAQD